MKRTNRRIGVSRSCDISFNEAVLNQLTVHLATAGVPIEQFAESSAQRTLFQSFNLRAGCDGGFRDRRRRADLGTAARSHRVAQ
jgi:hypothetical protein